MSNDWDYAKLSHLAKIYGGPEKLLDIIKKYNRQQGVKEGRLQLLPWVGVAFAGGWAVGQIPKAVQYFNSKFKRKQVTPEEAETAEKILIKGMKEADIQTEEPKKEQIEQ